jgi:hypothetical protein
MPAKRKLTITVSTKGQVILPKAIREQRHWPAGTELVPAEAIECFNPNAAVVKAEALSRKPGYVGAIAFSRKGDPTTGNFGDATVIRKFGDLPKDLSAL